MNITKQEFKERVKNRDLDWLLIVCRDVAKIAGRDKCKTYEDYEDAVNDFVVESIEYFRGKHVNWNKLTWGFLYTRAVYHFLDVHRTNKRRKDIAQISHLEDLPLEEDRYGYADFIPDERIKNNQESFIIIEDSSKKE